MGDVGAVVAALRSGQLVVLPTDTVYGLVCGVESAEPARALYALKGRPSIQPTAVVAASLAGLLEHLPELDGDAAAVARALLPGPYTLVVPNPARRFPWLNATAPEAIGVRVPLLHGDALAVVEEIGLVAASSANLAGGGDPRRLEDVAPEILAGVAGWIDGGELPGTPSTVIDLTADEPRVVREGAVARVDVLALVAAARERLNRS